MKREGRKRDGEGEEKGEERERERRGRERGRERERERERGLYREKLQGEGKPSLWAEKFSMEDRVCQTCPVTGRD
jgi:hypothetical protein